MNWVLVLPPFIRKGIPFGHDFNREALGIEVDFSLPSESVIRSLDQIITWRGKATVIRADNSPELVSGRLMEWAAKHQIHLIHIQASKLQQNAYVERFKRTVRYEWLTQHYWEALTKFGSLQCNGYIKRA